ncbi:MAG: ABC transporter ATP-binding protein, partial [Alphaproteobacteria bacterium]|nr:ABC transporter ATP-binding protein [Alphaproteobacteria bacterium]
AFNPDTLLMDEPFGNVDVQLKLQLQRELLTLWEGERKTVVFVTHDLEEAIALSDRVIVLSRRPGRVKADITVDLPRPRDPVQIRFERAFQDIHKQLWSLCDIATDTEDEHG